MSIVQPGLLRKHYQEATQDIEYRSSAFWQVVLQRAFYEVDRYSVTAESSPDESLRRVDMVVKRYDADNHTLSAMLWVECKRPSGSVQEVENQALDAARRCIARDDLMWIWAMTTIGVSFRMWFISDNDLELLPVHGTARGNPRQYIDADSPAASVFPVAIHSIKNGYPLRRPPVVPSQSLDLLAVNDTMEAGPSGGDYEHTDAGQFVEVQVEKKPHTLSHDEYLFRDIKRKKRSTKKDDWEMGDYQGQKVWFFHGKNVSYFSRKKIG